MNRPRISVVVSTRDRPERLRRLIAALRAQTLAPEAFEVVIADNRRGPAIAPNGAGPALRLLRPPVPGGPASGRNLGWRAARAPLIAFTDDDCEPEPGWLAALLAAAAAHPGTIVQGPTRPLECERHRGGLLAHTVSIEALGPQYETCNILYPRTLLERLGGFDERFGNEPAGEDTDLAWRARDARAPAVWAGDAVVRHAVDALTPVAALRRAARWGAVVRLYARHPRARMMLWRRYFWNVWHYLLWRSLLGLALPRPVRRAIIARHLLALAFRAREAGVTVWALPGAVGFLLAHDAVECAAIARGALRARTLVL